MTWQSLNGSRILWRNHSQATTFITSTSFPLPLISKLPPPLPPLPPPPTPPPPPPPFPPLTTTTVQHLLFSPPTSQFPAKPAASVPARPHATGPRASSSPPPPRRHPKPPVT